MATYVPAKVSTQFVFYASLVSQANTKIMQVNPTIASGDFKVSIDGGALANLGTLPTVTPAGGAMVKFTLSTSEMAGANATVVCSDAAGSEWCDLTVNIPTTARQIDDLAYPATSGRSMVVDASGLVDANAVKIGPTGAGTAQTARDLGASVLLSSGSGTGQLDFTSGVVKANATQILGGAIPAVTTTGVPKVDVLNWTGTAVSTPSTAGIVEVNLKNIANAAVSTSTAQLGVNAVNLGGTAQTGRDLGASVLLSAGTGTGQLDFTSGVVKANLAQILGTALTETAGLLAGGFKKFFNIITPAATMDHGVLVDTVTTTTTATTATNLTNAPTSGDFTATMKTSIGTAVAASAVASVTAGCTLTSGERNSVADALLDRSAGVETSFTPRQSLRLILSSVVAKLSGAATTTIAIRDINDTKDRITATVDASGNRSSVTTDVT